MINTIQAHVKSKIKEMLSKYSVFMDNLIFLGYVIGRRKRVVCVRGQNFSCASRTNNINVFSEELSIYPACQLAVSHVQLTISLSGLSDFKNPN